MNDDDRRILNFFYPDQYKDVPKKSSIHKDSELKIDQNLKSTTTTLETSPQSEIESKNKKIQKIQEAYNNRVKEKSNFSCLYIPEDGLTIKDPLDNGIEYATQVYNRYSFAHSYDRLPILQSHKTLINTIESAAVTIVCGSTGSGKTTQIPQYILDNCRDKDEHCNIVVTQPRRIAAMSVARRVCAERNWPIGQLVGYSIAHNKNTSPDTRICYVTTGVLIERIAHSIDVLDYYTHVIVDEVHERTVEVDILLLILSRYMKEKSKYIKVILMSATLDVTLFANYFASRVGSSVIQPPVVNVQGRMFNVSTLYSGEFNFLSSTANQIVSCNISKPDFSEQIRTLIINIILNIDSFEKNHKIECDKSRSSILVFLPGIPEVESLHERLVVRSLHSQISNDDQAQIFRRCDPGWRKIIFATNVAESSITVPDIKYVIDTCLHKQIECDRTIGLSCLKLNWISKSSGSQRLGRAGRVADGYCFRLVSRDFYENFDEFDTPEMKRSPLEQILLKVKKLELGPPTIVLQAAISPPDFMDLEKAMLVLKEIGALTLSFNGYTSTLDGDMTFLGMVLSNLPIDVRLGKFLFLSNILGLLDEAVVIAGMMSVKSVFTEQASNDLDVYINRMQWAKESFSDHIVLLEIYRDYKKQQANPSFNENKRLWSRSNFLSLRSLREADDVIGELFKRLFQMGIKPHKQLLDRPIIDNPKEVFLLKLALAGAFYPYYFTSGIVRFNEFCKQYYNKDIFNTVMVTGINRNTDFAQQIVKYFKEYSRIKKVTTESSRCYVEFEKVSTQSFDCNPSIFIALKKKNLSTNFDKGATNNQHLLSYVAGGRARFKKSFNGPYSPLELSFSFHPHLISARSPKISPASVNSISLYLHDKENLQYTYVGTDITAAYGGNKIKVLYSTAFPPFVGLAELLILLFSPNGEYRINNNENKITGAICGLGLDDETQQPLLSDNDVEICFPFHFTKDDAASVNSVRDLMNVLLSSDQNMNENLLNHLKSKLRQEIISIFEKIRVYEEPNYEDTTHALSYRWNMLPRYQQKDDIDPEIEQFWSDAIYEASKDDHNNDDNFLYFCHSRVKKMMKQQDKSMAISKGATKLMAKGCELFLQELFLKLTKTYNEDMPAKVKEIHLITTLLRDKQYDFLFDDFIDI